MHSLITDLDNFSESEWFLREFGLKFQPVMPENVSPDPKIKAILTCSLDKWQKLLFASNPNSLVIFLLGNERYLDHIFIELNRWKSIKIAFVQHLPSDRTKVEVKHLINFLKWQPELLLKRTFYRILLESSRAARKIKNMRFIPETYPLPAGYSNRFASELVNLGLVRESSSLFEQSPISNSTSRIKGMVFIGQHGSWLRRRIIQAFMKIQGAAVTPYTSWGGAIKSNETRYSESLLNYRFCLCPPGNLSNESYRYYEAIVLGCIPVVTSITIQDWNKYGYWPEVIDIGFRDLNHLQIFNRLLSMSDDDLTSLSNQIHILEYSRILKLKGKIQESLC